MSKPVILTGLRATNDLHLGNYFGAVMPLIDMAKGRAGQYQANLFVVDLHSLTTPIVYNKLYDQVINNLKLYVAAGLPLDNPDIHLYRQSHIPANSEAAWIFDCFTGFGELSRMTQFKDKSSKLTQDRISVGLFNYPALMAADILLYRAAYIPVGEDQTQHLEYTRDIAERFNKQFGEIFVIPKPVAEQHSFFGKEQGLRIKDLLDPSKKMSKSDETGNGVLFLTDPPELAEKKIMSATTDSFGSIKLDWKAQPGISNLLQISALLSNEAVEEVAKQWTGKSSYGELKQSVAKQVKEFLVSLQNNLAKVDETALLKKLEQDEATMNKIANETLLKVQKAVGLRPQ